MFKSPEQITELFHSFSGAKVLVIGDVMIDTYLKGKVDRISPEAPVPVVALQQRSDHLGGAANVALNLKSLGAVPLLCSVIGDDAQGEEFMKLLGKEEIEMAGILKESGRRTTTKYRIIGNNVQMLRVDHESDSELGSPMEKELILNVERMMDQWKPEVVIFQDYDKGVLTAGVIEGIIRMSHSRGIPVAVDPKKKHFGQYKAVTLFKPNLKEIREGLHISIDTSSMQSLQDAALRIQNGQQARWVMITLSDEGVFISSGKESFLIKAHHRSIADVSGAGDTVISVAALCLARRLGPSETASLANLAGGLVCEHVGVVPVNKDRLLLEALKLLVD